MSESIILKKVRVFDVRKDGLKDARTMAEMNLDTIQNRLIALVANTSPVYHDEHGDVSIVDYAAREVPELLEEYGSVYGRMVLIDRAISDPKNVVNA